MKNYRAILYLFLLTHFFCCTIQAQWQWSIPVTKIISPETKQNPQAFLWIPENCKQLKAVVIGQHNMSEEGILEHPKFRKEMAKLGIGAIWVSPGFDMPFDFTKGAGQVFESIMTDLAQTSGYSELAYIPVIPIGHSAYATFPWNFAAWNPSRTLAILSIHGDAPQTNLTGYGNANIAWNTKNIDGIPGLMVEGEYEWWEARVAPALQYKIQNPNAAISFLCDAGHGHFDVSDELIDYLSLFIKKAIKYRFPATTKAGRPIELLAINPELGWLKERWKKDTNPSYPSASFKKYKGDKKVAFWYFDKEIATVTEKYYAKSRGKKDQYIGFTQDGKLLSFNPKSHARIQAPFTPDSDGLTFHINPVFTDTLRTKISNDHATGKITINRICGPVEKVNDTTFTVRFYRMGIDNPKRTGDIWLIGQHPGDGEYKSSVQQFNMRIPIENTEGMEQKLTLEPIPNVLLETRSLPLKASSNSGLPVYFYVKEGPAIITNSELIITGIPPKTKFPVKITVVAWQYGRATEPKIKTATPIEQSFYILNNK